MLWSPVVVVWLQLASMHADPFLRDVPTVAVPATVSPKAVLGIATIFGYPKDRNGGGSRLACAPDYRVQTLPEMNVCAHRTHRCGTILAIQNVRNKKITLCRVLDRGPYGALLEDDTWVIKIRRDDPGTWRGIADLTPSVAAAIGHRGYERVRLWPVYKPAKKIVVKPLKERKHRKAREERTGV